MTAFHRLRVLALVIVAAPLWAEETTPPTDSAGSWRDGVIARCMQQYSAEQCQDNNFLEENFHVTSLEAAHNTSMQRNREEKKAMRELTLQRICSMPASSLCANDAEPAQCGAQIGQECATLQLQANNCGQSAVLTCATFSDANACVKSRLVLCPSLKRQPIEQFLLKYPKLNAAQKGHLIAAAQELDAQTGWWPNLIARLKAPLQ